MPNGHAWSSSRRALRYRLTLLLRRAGRPLNLDDLATALDQAGWPAPDPATKSISDSLRWEVAKGRVVRVGRGRYAAGHVDRRTAWWLQRQLDEWERVERLSESPARPAGQSTEPPTVPRRAPESPAWLRALRPETVNRLSEARNDPAA
jgi:hypothetical protein